MSNKLIDAIQAEVKEPEWMNQYDIGYNYGLLTAKNIAIKLDAVPVTRCKNCALRAKRLDCQFKRDDDFCSSAKRRDD